MYVLNKISLDYKDDKSRNKLKGVAKSLMQKVFVTFQS